MRALVVIAAGLTMTACASTERVTLLHPVQVDKRVSCELASRGATAEDGTPVTCPVGGVVVEHRNGRTAYISEENQQARLGRSRSPRVQSLDEADPFHAEVMNSLPIEPVRGNFYFALGEGTLASDELERLQIWLNAALDGREGAEVEIAAHTDATGTQAINDRISTERANAVLAQVYQAIDAGGVAVSKDDVNAVPGSWHWARSYLEPDEVGQPDDRFRVVVVTVR